MAVLAMRDALNQALREEMKRDESVFLLGEDIGLYDGSFKVTRGLMKEFGEKRVLDTPIAEEIIIGTAIGAAMSGLRPVAEMMTVNFIMVAMDQVVNAAAHIRYMFGGGTKVPLVIRTPGGGGHQLGAQHSHSHENWFAHVPGLKVVAPGTHDTASAVAAIPLDGPDEAFISSGTWSLMGFESRVPFANATARRLNFSNEGGLERRYRVLKNIMGLWLVQRIRQESASPDPAMLVEAARAAEPWRSSVPIV